MSHARFRASLDPGHGPTWVDFIKACNTVRLHTFDKPAEVGDWWAGGTVEKYADANVLHRTDGTVSIVATTELGRAVIAEAGWINGVHVGASGPSPTYLPETLPTGAAVVIADVAAHMYVPVEDLIVRDHTHEGLRPGAFTIAYEGDRPDWPHRFAADRFGAEAVAGGRFYRNWTCEAVSHVVLGVYPVDRAV